MTDWTMAWAFRNLVAEFLMPPGIFLLCILCAAFWINSAKCKKTIFLLATVGLWMVSTPFFAQSLVQVTQAWMLWPSPLTPAQIEQTQAQAIVVLGGGRRKSALESWDYQQQDLTKDSLERLRYAAWLAKKTHLPILVSGGAPDRTSSEDLAEAKVMQMILEKEYGLSAKWIESQSLTTQENAEFSGKLLNQSDIQQVLLVTHYWHMPRAKAIFEQYGMEVQAAPHGFNSVKRYTPLDFYPGAIQQTRQIWHELIGQLWYRLRY